MRRRQHTLSIATLRAPASDPCLPALRRAATTTSKHCVQLLGLSVIQILDPTVHGDILRNELYDTKLVRVVTRSSTGTAFLTALASIVHQVRSALVGECWDALARVAAKLERGARVLRSRDSAAWSLIASWRG